MESAVDVNALDKTDFSNAQANRRKTRATETIFVCSNLSRDKVGARSLPMLLLPVNVFHYFVVVK